MSKEKNKLSNPGEVIIKPDIAKNGYMPSPRPTSVKETKGLISSPPPSRPTKK